MNPLGPVPFRNVITGKEMPSEPWTKWFRDIFALLTFENNHSRTPAPTLTGVSEVGTVNKTMAYIKDRNMVQLQLVLAPTGGGTVALASATLTNLPYKPSHAAVGLLVNTVTLAVVGGIYAAPGGLIMNLPNLGASADPHVATLTYRTEDA